MLLGLNLLSVFGKCFIGNAQFDNESGGVYLIHTVELVSSASEVLAFELLSIVRVLGSAELNGAVCGADLDPLLHSPDPLCNHLVSF